MGKNIKLTNKTNNAKPEKEKIYLFVKDQGEGAAAIVVVILKVLGLIGTSIYGLALGIFAPLTLMFGDFDEGISQSPALVIWLITAVVYIVGMFIVMLGHSKIASVVHTAGMVGVLLTYYNFMVLFKDVPDNNGPSVLYMPLLFVTVITIVIMLLINVPKWVEAHVEKVNAVAPSILKDEED